LLLQGQPQFVSAIRGGGRSQNGEVLQNLP
jgi:hypothetical protein